MRLALWSFLIVAAALFASASYADTIDDFTLASASHTISFSLPATSAFPEHFHFDFFPENASTTIDGVPGYSLNADFYIVPNFGYIAVLFGLPASISTDAMLRLSGPTFFTYISVPAVNPYPGYYQDDIVPTFTPGTYNLRAASSDPFFPTPTPYTLSIVPEASSVPEPPTLILLTLPALSTLSRRRRPRIVRAQ